MISTCWIIMIASLIAITFISSDQFMHMEPVCTGKVTNAPQVDVNCQWAIGL